MPTTLPVDCLERLTDNPVAAVTADGGCRLCNPSPWGGMWAFRYTDAAGSVVAQASGVVTVAEAFPLTTVTNNFTETLALLLALEGMPAGWSGVARTDSLNAIRVFQNYRDPKKVAAQTVWLPLDIIARVRAVRERLGPFTYELLAGHPDKVKGAVARLEAGETVISDRGYPFCIHNHWCDKSCQAAWHIYEGLNNGR